MRPDEGQTEYEEVQKELSCKEQELQVTNCYCNSSTIHQVAMISVSHHLSVSLFVPCAVAIGIICIK